MRARGKLHPEPPVLGPERYLYARCSLLRVVDGDTVVLRFPLPFHVKMELDVRLLGINAPERVGADAGAGAAATAYLLELLSSADSLTAQTRRTDKYGRWLAEIWASHLGVWSNVNAAMLAAGHSVPYWPKSEA